MPTFGRRPEAPPPGVVVLNSDPLFDLRNAEGTTGISAMLVQRDSGARLAEYLPTIVSVSEAADSNSTQQWIWERCGIWLMISGRLHEALLIFQALYRHMLDFQTQTETWTHKGMPLVWISDCYGGLGYRVHAKRFIMLTLIEDAIRDEGKILPEDRGVYFRAIQFFGLPDRQVGRYASETFRIFGAHLVESRFPEWVLQEFDQDWMTELPSVEEALHYSVNPRYVLALVDKLGIGFANGSDGKALERLAHYLLGSIAGCRAIMRARTHSTDYDVVCGVEGVGLDFRSELGRYFLCECKDWDRPANVDVMMKFCSVLNTVDFVLKLTHLFAGKLTLPREVASLAIIA